MKKSIIAIVVVVLGLLGYNAYKGGSSGGSGADLSGDSLKQSLVTKSCSPTSSDYKAEVLGYVEDRDDLQNQWYGFIICKITDLTKTSNNWEVKVASNWVTGTSLTPVKALELAAKAQAAGKPYFTFGDPYVPVGDADVKRIEYRFYQSAGKVTDVEVYAVLRNADRSAKPAKTLSVVWPSA